MAFRSNQPDEEFSEGYTNWDVERLYTDLAGTNSKSLSRNAKRFLRGVLCGYSPAEIAKKCRYRGKDPSATVRQTLSKEIYPAIEELLKPSEKIEWNKVQVPRLLEGYRKKPKNQLPEESQLAETIRIIQGMQQNQQVTISSANLISLPPTLEKWQGRTTEIQQLQGWLADTKVKTIGIQGLSGVGKSWLAAYLYESISFELKFWADVRQGTDFTVFAQNALMQLAGKSPEELAALREPEQLIFALLDSLRQRPCLLVVDNLETLLDQERHFIGIYRDFFNRWIEHGATSTLLLTTQTQAEVMEGHGCWLPLQGLEATEGARLLQELGIVGSDEELQDFSRYLNGHPKMLRLVASKLKPGSHVREAEKLHFRQLDLLLNKVPMPYRDRERVLFVSILEQHFQDLTPTLRSFFLNLSLYRRSFERDAAAVLTEGEESASAWETQQALDELTSRSLLDVVIGKQRYQFHPFVLQYAKQKAGTQQDVLHKKNIAYKSIAYYLSIAPDRSTWKILEDVTPYLEIFYILCELEQYAQAFDTLDACANFLDLRGYNAIRAELCEWLVQYWTPTEEEKCEFGAALTLLGNTYQALRQDQQAFEYHQQSLKIAREIGDCQGEAISLSNLGCACDALGQYQQALEYHQQSLKIAEKIGDRKGQAVSLGGIASVYESLGKYQQALEYHQQSLEIKKQIGDLLGQAFSLNGMGRAYQGLEQYQRAIKCHQQSLEIDHELGNLQGEAISFGNLGETYQLLGKYQQVIECHQQSLEIQRQLGNKQGEATSLASLGNAYCFAGKYPQAICFYQQSLEIKIKVGVRQGEIVALNGLGVVYQALGEYQQAIECHQQSLEIARETGTCREAELTSLGNLGDVYYLLGEFQQAIEYSQESLEISQQLGSYKGQEAALCRLGNSYGALGQYEQAIGFHQQSLKIAQEIGDWRGEALSLSGLGSSYRDLGQYEQAIEFYQQSLKITQELGDLRAEAFCLLGLGNSYGDLEQYQQAIEFYQQSLEIAREIGDRRVEATVLFNSGTVLIKLSRKSEAITAIQNARVLYEAMELDEYVQLANDVIQGIS